MSENFREYLKRDLPNITNDLEEDIRIKIWDFLLDKILNHLCDDCIKKIFGIE